MTWWDGVLGLAALAALAGLRQHGRTLVPLLASLALCTVLDRSGAVFDPLVWLAVDGAVLIALLRPGMRWQDWAVAALFLPAWATYFGPWWLVEPVVNTVVALQLLLCFPFCRFLRALRARPLPPPSPHPFDDFDLKVQA